MTAPPAGWYPDPEGQGGSRWWDGEEWTEHLKPEGAGALSSAGTSPASQSEAADPATNRQVLRCDICNQRRDSRVEACKNCGGTTASVDTDMPPGEVVYLTDDVRDIDTLGIPLSRELLLERHVALAQEMAILEGAETPPSAAFFRRQFEREREDRALQVDEEMEARALEQALTGPYSSGRWEANPYGLSGRMIRGYRHWRNKR